MSSTAAEYPLATRFIAAKHFRRIADSRAVDKIVIHITDGSDLISGTIGYFQDPRDRNGNPLEVSAHYIVGQDGEVVQMVRNNDVAFHAHSADDTSIGIEHCARQPHALGTSDPGLSPTQLQYEASAVLVRYLCEEYGIPMDRAHIIGHSEADPRTAHASCPNGVLGGWKWDDYMRMVTSATSLPI